MSAPASPVIPGVTLPPVARRYGLKGPAAADWLRQQGIAVPARPNCVTHWAASSSATAGRCLRLGGTEFLVEEDVSTGTPAASPTSADRAWLLLRNDHSLLLDGPPWPAELSQLCSFDFSRLHDEPDLVVMTLLAGISVTLVREPSAVSPDGIGLRLWCDASYARYLQQCLHHITRPAPPSPGEQR